MPTPVACLLKSPVMKFIFVFNGSIDCRLLPNSISAPEPLAHQCCELIPLPMNNAAKRFGNGLDAASRAGPAPQTGIDSSHGSAIATPTPRRNVRREARLQVAIMALLFKACISFIFSSDRSDLDWSEIADS